jgi:ribokinase
LIVYGCLTLDNVVTAEGVRLPQVFAGNALYAALGARVWNDSVGVVSRAGVNYPSACFDLLDHLGVAHEGVRRSPASHGRNMAFVYSPDGSRSRRIPAEIMAAIPAEERDRFLDTTLQPDAREKWLAFSPNADDTPEDWWSATKGVHCAAIPMARQATIVAAARSRAARDVWAQIDSPWQDKAAHGRESDTGLLADLDALLPSEADLADYCAGVPPAQVVRTLLAVGAKRIILKRGGEGCDIYGSDGATIHVPVVSVRAVDPTGAGDAFCGGFLAGVCATGDVLMAARQGAVSASFAIERNGLDGLARADRREAAARLSSLVQN